MRPWKSFEARDQGAVVQLVHQERRRRNRRRPPPRGAEHRGQV